MAVRKQVQVVLLYHLNSTEKTSDMREIKHVY